MAAGVVGAHALAYRVTATPTSPLHHYLEHVPQVLSVLAVAGLAFGGLASRLGGPAAWPFPLAAVATFVVQEHVERLAHTGDVPWLLGSRVFLVGLLLQVPVALRRMGPRTQAAVGIHGTRGSSAADSARSCRDRGVADARNAIRGGDSSSGARAAVPPDVVTSGRDGGPSFWRDQ